MLGSCGGHEIGWSSMACVCGSVAMMVRASASCFMEYHQVIWCTQVESWVIPAGHGIEVVECRIALGPTLNLPGHCCEVLGLLCVRNQVIGLIPIKPLLLKKWS
jgi:hypothetical protein